MALSGLDIYKLLPKTNCKECGFVTCLAFAMQLAKKAVDASKCPYLSEEAKRVLLEASQPPIRLVTVGCGEKAFSTGNETVLFRHEEKFRNPCGLGFIIDDCVPGLKTVIERLNAMVFDRVGEELKPDLIVVRQTAGIEQFVSAVRQAAQSGKFALGLVTDDPAALKQALEAARGSKPLVLRATAANLESFSALAAEYGAVLAVNAPGLEAQAQMVKELNKRGIQDIILDCGDGSPLEKIWMLTQWRRQALKKNNRVFGYPSLAVVDTPDAYSAAVEAAGYIAKYAGLVLLNCSAAEEVFALLALRQNIYSDPQKPLQIEPKIYPVGKVSKDSPVLVTTNFSLSYFTVLSEVETSKIPSYILSVDTEGMSVLTAWAAEKFTPEKISESLDKFEAGSLVGHKQLVIPGYVAMMSGSLEEKSGWQIVVGPKEASGIPAFLKNL